MKIIGIMLVASQLLFSISSYASAYDIKGERVAIQNTFLRNGKIRFDLCKMQMKDVVCKPIGKKSGYTLKELNEIKRSELIEARWKTGGAAAVALVGGVAGFYFGAVTLIGAGAVTEAGAIGLSGVTFLAGTTATGAAVTTFVAGAAATAMKTIDKVNPIHQFAQADVLNEPGLLTNIDVEKADKEILEIAELLQEILN